MRPDPIEIEPDAWCEWCGDPLPEPEERHSRRRFCSRRCKDDARNARTREEWAAELVAKDCPHCGVTFKPNRTCQIFCGDSCQQKARYRRRTGRPVRLTDIACLHCNAMFTPRTLSQKYCGTPCKARAHMARKG